MTADIQKKLNILLLFDLPFEPEADHDYSVAFAKDWDYRCERDVMRTLQKLGHKVKPFGIFAKTDELIREIKQNKYDLVFCTCESFRNDRDLAPNVASLLEMMGVKYTGASPDAQRLCRDKGLTKKILAYHGIGVPRFEIFRKGELIKLPDDFPMPCIVKPLELESSEGISGSSVVKNRKQAEKRIRFIQKKLAADVIVEEFIAGRELFVGVLGNDEIATFPPRELFFESLPASQPKIFSYHAKWNDHYRKKWGVSTGKAEELSVAQKREIASTCQTIYKVFNMNGYARVDLRLSKDAKLYFLEVNPNPAINAKDEFAASAKLGGVAYTDLIKKIVKLGLAS